MWNFEWKTMFDERIKNIVWWTNKKQMSDSMKLNFIVPIYNNFWQSKIWKNYIFCTWLLSVTWYDISNNWNLKSHCCILFQITRKTVGNTPAPCTSAYPSVQLAKQTLIDNIWHRIGNHQLRLIRLQGKSGDGFSGFQVASSKKNQRSHQSAASSVYEAIRCVY